MPAFCTHYLFSEDMLDTMKAIADFDINQKVVALGSQGPDIFFFNKPYKIVGAKREIGSALHRSKPEDIFNALCDYLTNNNNSIAKSYAYGFILHYALDRNCHPYVFAKEQEMTLEKKIHHSSAHNIIEMALDSYLLHKKMSIDNSRDFDTSKTIELNEEEKNEIGNILSFVINAVTQYTTTVADIVDAIDDTVLFQKVLRDRHGVLNGVCVGVETILAPAISHFKISSLIKPKCWKNGIKYANIDKEPWHSPYDEENERTESFEDLYDYSLNDAKCLLVGFEKLLVDEDNARTITNNISFLTGRSVE